MAHSTQCLPFYGNCQEALLSGDHSLKRVHESRAVYLAVCAIKPLRSCLVPARNGKWKRFFVAPPAARRCHTPAANFSSSLSHSLLCASNTHSLASFYLQPSGTYYDVFHKLWRALPEIYIRLLCYFSKCAQWNSGKCCHLLNYIPCYHIGNEHFIECEIRVSFFILNIRFA